MDNDQEIEHPSFGLVSFSRRQGNPRLFGSDLDAHYNYVALKISRATLIRGDHGDRYRGSFSGDVIEVDMSAAQFAALLTSMNVAPGTPCTIRRLMGKGVESPPTLVSRIQNISDRFKEGVHAFANVAVRDSLERARVILEKERLTKSDRQELLAMYETIWQNLKHNVPFITELLNEAVTERIQAAKAEVDAFTTSVLVRIGLKTLQSAAEAAKELPDVGSDA